MCFLMMEQDARCCFQYITAQRFAVNLELLHYTAYHAGICYPLCNNGLSVRQHGLHILFNRSDIFFPGTFPACLRSCFGLHFNFPEGGLIRQCVFQDPLAHFYVAIKFLFPCETFLTFITLMRSAGRVALWLSDLFYMEQRRNMCFPDFAQAILK